MQVYNDQQVFEHFMRSNIPKQEKGVIRQWFDRVTGGRFTTTLEKLGDDGKSSISVGSVLIAGVEAGACGAILGTIHAELTNGLDAPGFPIDAAAGAINLASAAALDSPTLKTLGISCMSVFGFRSFDAMLKVRKELTGRGIFGVEESKSSDDSDGAVAAAAKEVFSEEAK